MQDYGKSKNKKEVVFSSCDCYVFKYRFSDRCMRFGTPHRYALLMDKFTFSLSRGIALIFGNVMDTIDFHT